MFLSWIGVSRVLVSNWLTCRWAGNELGHLNLKSVHSKSSTRKLARSAGTLRFVELVVSMSFPKAPLKRFNDPSGAYGGRN